MVESSNYFPGGCLNDWLIIIIIIIIIFCAVLGFSDDLVILHSYTNILTFFFGEFEKFRKATVSFVMSACLSAWNNSAPTGRIFIKGFVKIY